MAERQSLKGTHRARAGEVALGVKKSGKEHVAVMFTITQGDAKGRTISWDGYFSDGAVVRTLESLRHCGWTGETLGDLSGIGDVEVDLVIDDEEYNGKTYDRVKWINKPQQLFINRMGDAAVNAFAERMARLTRDSKTNYGGAKPTESKAAPPREGYDGPMDDMGDLPF
jgi:hypothetical protein